MKKIFSLALILVMSMVVLTGCGNNQQGKTDKKIIVGLDDNFPPMGFIGDNNEIIGFDIDLATHVGLPNSWLVERDAGAML